MSTKAQVKTQAKTPAASAKARIPQPPVAEPEREAERPAIATQLEGAARLGHSLGAIGVRSAASATIQAMPPIQRQELPAEHEEELQMKREPAAIQRQELPEDEEEEELQMKPEAAAVQRQDPEEELTLQPDIPGGGLHGGPVALGVEAAIQRATGGAVSEVRQENRTGLPDNLKAGLEDLSGLAMDDVRVHYNSSKPAEINAHAFTQGKDIHIASGQETHLPHEGWHVVQQAQGRVKPTMQLKDGVPVNDDQRLEREADVMGAKAVQMRRTGHATFAPIAQATALEAQDREATEASEVPGAAIRAYREKGRLNSLSSGQDLFFQQGGYQSGSRSGQELIAHELTHVIQQSNVRKSSPTSLNAKTVRGQASANILQRALWANSPAKFRTDNEEPEIPNSEYNVYAGGYMRYAPINLTRALEQVFHEGPRSFVYIEGTNITDRKYDAVWEHPIVVTAVTGDEVTFKTEKPGYEGSPEVKGKITPTSGATVFDFGVNDTTRQLDEDSHVGHPVEDLGAPLPTLDDPDALQAARDYQHFLIAQYLMLYAEGMVQNYKEWNEKSQPPTK
jgi:hypothetical protein